MLQLLAVMAARHHMLEYFFAIFVSLLFSVVCNIFFVMYVYSKICDTSSYWYIFYIIRLVLAIKYYDITFIMVNTQSTIFGYYLWYFRSIIINRACRIGFYERPLFLFNRFLNIFTVSPDTTSVGSEFHVLTVLFV